MAKIDNITLGTVRVYNKSFSRSFRALYTGDGFSYPQDVNWTERGWNVRGTLNAQAQSVIDGIENLNNYGLPVLLDLDDKYTGFIQWVIVDRFTVTPVKGTIYRYDLNVTKIPCIGTMYIQTNDIFLHDLNYRANYKMVDPLVGRFNKAWSVNRLEQTWEFYLDNDKNAFVTAILEIFAGDDVIRFTLWGWKAAAWSLIGDWGTGGADAWNAIKVWTDEDGAPTHNFQAQKGERGGTLPGIGVISWKLGNLHRVLIEIENIAADANPTGDLSTHYGGDQLLLKAKLYSTSREALRPNPIVTYITGGLGPDPA